MGFRTTGLSTSRVFVLNLALAFGLAAHAFCEDKRLDDFEAWQVTSKLNSVNCDLRCPKAYITTPKPKTPNDLCIYLAGYPASYLELSSWLCIYLI